MNIKIPIAITVGVIVIALAIGAGIWMANKSGDQVVQKACTMEARVCPDGSAVARTGPNCEFEACPENKDKNIVGNDRDEHGCIGSAGYSRCEEKKKCLRSWEESCSGATIYDSSKEEIYQNGESYFKITVPDRKSVV